MDDPLSRMSAVEEHAMRMHNTGFIHLQPRRGDVRALRIGSACDVGRAVGS